LSEADHIVSVAAERLRDARALIVGISGYLGSPLGRALVAGGCKVVGASRTTPDALADPITWEAVDLTSRQSVGALVRQVKPDLVFNVAGVTSAARLPAQVGATFGPNALGTVLLLEACLESECGRYVHCASMEEPRDDANATPKSPYGASKWVGSMYTRMFQSVFRLHTSIVRPFFVYGPGRQPADKLVPYLVASFLKGVAPRLSSPHRAMDWVFIDDVVEGFLRSATIDAAIGRDIELGSGHLTTIAVVSELLAREAGCAIEPIETPASERSDETSPVADVEAARNTIGWTATTSLASGVRKTLDWYRAQRPL